MENPTTGHAVTAPLLTDEELLEWIEEDAPLMTREEVEEWIENVWVRTNPSTNQILLVFEKVLPLIAEWSPFRLPQGTAQNCALVPGSD